MNSQYLSSKPRYIELFTLADGTAALCTMPIALDIAWAALKLYDKPAHK